MAEASSSLNFSDLHAGIQMLMDNGTPTSTRHSAEHFLLMSEPVYLIRFYVHP
jgi:hypothetical protein